MVGEAGEWQVRQGSGRRGRGVDDVFILVSSHSSASHPSSVLSDSFECCHKWSWNNIDPEKSLMLSKFTESQLTSDSWTCSCEQDRETLKDLGYLTKSIRKDR